ncbi:MFS transporter [Blastococcus sp. LR1]|uniref:MFS transporter n=1 Tax=Blastococcus sp. LR1 TaxID=2877000 RepID=UPI001CCE1BC2|nr:MFS transporter [Blastococcus sp. LR1]MCA0144043.1 MFS transporter [Blastococcus sp. LR1]
MAGRTRAAHASQGALRGRGHPHPRAPAGQLGRRRVGVPLTTDTAKGGTSGAPVRQATFRQVFAVREFRALFGTFLLSAAGDELARVALTVLVYARTESPLLAALTFAIGYLPWLLGGPLLSALADRFPRREVLIATDLARAALVALMALPGVPLWLLLFLLFVVGLCAPPFESARSALMTDVLDDDRYAVATSIVGSTVQLAQVGGFLAGGALLLVFSPSTALLVDAATFLISAVWLGARLQRRPAPAAADDATGPPSLWQDALAGLRLVRGTPRLLAIIGVVWLGTGFLYAPEGIAAPLADELGGGPTAVGVLLAANPLGLTIGGLGIARLVPPHHRERLVEPLVVLSLAAVLASGLVAVLAGPGPSTYWTVVALLFVSGLGGAWTIPLNVAFVQAVPRAYRGRAFGVAVSGIAGIQGIGALASGLAAEAVGPSMVVALAGGLGMIALAPVLWAYRGTRIQAPATVDAEGASRE